MYILCVYSMFPVFARNSPFIIIIIVMKKCQNFLLINKFIQKKKLRTKIFLNMRIDTKWLNIIFAYSCIYLALRTWICFFHVGSLIFPYFHKCNNLYCGMRKYYVISIQDKKFEVKKRTKIGKQQKIF